MNIQLEQLEKQAHDSHSGHGHKDQQIQNLHAANRELEQKVHNLQGHANIHRRNTYDFSYNQYNHQNDIQVNLIQKELHEKSNELQFKEKMVESLKDSNRELMHELEEFKKQANFHKANTFNNKYHYAHKNNSEDSFDRDMHQEDHKKNSARSYEQDSFDSDTREDFGQKNMTDSQQIKELQKKLSFKNFRLDEEINQRKVYEEFVKAYQIGLAERANFVMDEEYSGYQYTGFQDEDGQNYLIGEKDSHVGDSILREFNQTKFSEKVRKISDNGVTFYGDFSQNDQEQRGFWKFANQNKFQGNLENGSLHGQCKFFDIEKGNLYEGTISEDCENSLRVMNIELQKINGQETESQIAIFKNHTLKKITSC